MSRIRFATIRALSESFPEALDNIGAVPTDEHPIAFLKRLAAERKFDHAGGTFAPTPIPVPAYMTARGVRVALLISSRSVSLPERPKRLQFCLAEGLRLAETGP